MDFFLSCSRPDLATEALSAKLVNRLQVCSLPLLYTVSVWFTGSTFRSTRYVRRPTDMLDFYLHLIKCPIAAVILYIFEIFEITTVF